MQPVIVDVDTGVDDALALAVALAQPELRLIAVTTVAGNVDVGQATRNTRLVLDWLGARSIPVAKGAASPLLRKHRDARAYHGPDVLGGVVLPVERGGPILDTSAPEVIVRAARRYAGKLCLVCLAPLTNLAIALRLEPDLPFLIDRVIVMGGAFAVAGNVTPAAEFNVWSDPEAASLVAQAGFRIRWVGLDVTELVRLERSRWERLGNATDPRSDTRSRSWPVGIRATWADVVCAARSSGGRGCCAGRAHRLGARARHRPDGDRRGGGENGLPERSRWTSAGCAPGEQRRRASLLGAGARSRGRGDDVAII